MANEYRYIRRFMDEDKLEEEKLKELRRLLQEGEDSGVSSLDPKDSFEQAMNLIKKKSEDSFMTSLRVIVKDLQLDIFGAILAIQKLKEIGAIIGQHEGKNDLTSFEKAEFYAGNVLEQLEYSDLRTIFEICNKLDTFVPPQAKREASK